MIRISDYLEDFNKQGNRGNCKVCKKKVIWSTERLSSHKRMSCPAIGPEEKRKFAKRTLENIQISNDANPLKVQNISANSGLLSEEQRDDISAKLANFFFRTGISLRLADSAAFKDFVSSLNPVYAEKTPSSKTISGPLLDQQYGKFSKILEEILDTSQNLTLVSDGWTNIRGDHIVNFCVKAQHRKPFFYSAINTSGIKQDAPMVANAVIAVIEKLSPKKFCSLITDNAPVLKAAWRIIEDKYPHISAHAVNLLIKDILDSPEISRTIKETEKIIKFVKNHHMVNAKYEQIRQEGKVPHTLSMAVTTRWFSRYTSLNDLSASKYVLIKLVDEAAEIINEVTPKKTTTAVINLIKSTEFWDKLAKLVKKIEYPANIIGKLEADEAPLCLVYHYFGELFNNYANDEAIQAMVKNRLQFVFNETVGLAYMLTPKFAAKGFYFNDDLTDIIGYASELAQKCNLIKADPEKAEQMGAEMIAFVTKMSTLPPKQEEIIFKMGAKSYWNIIGRREFPTLFELAKPIAEMICSSATAERVWSTFNFIHSKLRNRLTNERVNKLVFLYANCFLLDETDQEDYINDIVN